MADPLTSTVDKIKLIDGTVVNLSSSVQLNIPELCHAYVTWDISDFTGTVTKISGTAEDYQLNINEHRT